jgi:DNA-binding beta-propeller fold protein YncE
MLSLRFIVLTTAFVTSLFAGSHRVGADVLAFELAATSPESFAEPHDIVLSPGGDQLFVADNGNDRIVVLDSQSLSISYVVAEGMVAEPHDVDFDASGRLLVADTGNNRIAIFSLTESGATLVDELTERIRRPEGVAVHEDGRVFVCGTGSGNLVVFRDGSVIDEFRGLSSPHNVEFDLAGQPWVADTGADRLIRFDNDLTIVQSLNGESFDFNGPRYMDFDSSGRLIVADKYSHQIKIISPAGELLQRIGDNNAGKGEGVFDRPEGVEIRDRDYWFSDTYNDRIVRYNLK